MNDFFKNKKNNPRRVILILCSFVLGMVPSAPYAATEVAECPSIPRLKARDFFWSQEWDKHGGCSEPTYDQLWFFVLAMLFDKFNIYTILTNGGIIPGKNIYELNRIIVVVRKATTKAPELGCFDPGNIPRIGDIQELREIRICFDKFVPDPLIIDCPRRTLMMGCTSNHIMLPAWRLMVSRRVGVAQNLLAYQFGQRCNNPYF